MNRQLRPALRAAVAAILALTAALTGALSAPSAQAATLFVSSEPAASWQVDGVVYTTLIVGDTVYVGGSFTHAVSPNGTLVNRKNLAAFNMVTGALVTSFDVAAGSAVRALATDGRALYVGGNFAKLGTSTRPYIGKVDLVSGAVDPAFNPQPDNAVRGIVVDDGQVFLGGAFLNVGGAPRTRLAKVDATTGALDPSFTGSANNVVYGLTKNADSTQLYVVGLFSTVSGVARNGITAVDELTGAVVGPVFANAARPSYAVHLNEDGTRMYVAGGSATNASAAWNTTTGARLWRVVTDGDNQALAYFRGVVYIGFHDGFQGDSGLKLLAVDAATGAVDPGFKPRFDDFWGVWSIDVTERGLIAGGDFTSVNNLSTQGLVRFPANGTPPPPAPTSVPLLGPNTAWQYWDQGGRPAGWEQPAFDSSAWQSGPPRLGYGDTFTDTVIGFGPTSTSKFLTSYFRAPFTVDTMPDGLNLQISVDDGAVVYLNGVEIGRNNMPTGAVTESTLASGDRSGGNETALYSVPAPASLLHTGTNWLAIEVHQFSRSSSDLGLDVDLAALYNATASTNASPVAAFTSNMSLLSGAFDGTGSSDPDGSVASYHWDFGDGATATGPTATHAYAAPGTYPVVLSVLDDKGALSTVTHQVTAESATQTLVAPKSQWRWWYATAAPPATWRTTGLDDSTWSAGAAPLGFGSTSVATNIDTFATTSARPVTAYFRRSFTVADPAKISRLTVQTVADDGVVVYVNGTEVQRSRMPAGTIGSGTFASAAVRTASATPVTFDVSPDLLVSGTNVITAETHLNFRATPDESFDLSLTAVSGNVRPTASYSWSGDALTASFDGSASSDPDGGVTAYSWSFGDGTTATGPVVQHTFPATGTYKVALTVVDGDGAQGTTTKDVTVSGADPVVIPFGSDWRWRYDAAAPPVAWNTSSFDPGTWKLGGGVLGFGDPSVKTNIDTFASSADRPRAAYFVRQLSIADAASVTRLTLDTVADDGVVVYVNGTEVGRANMPAGTPSIVTNASAAVRTANASRLSLDVPVSLLRTGVNVVAVETHLNYRATPDVTFDLRATLLR